MLTMNRKAQNITSNSPIGLFDSGIGGMTIAHEIFRLLPNEKIIYIEDEKHCPYGEKTQDQLKELCLNIGHWLEEQGVKLVVIACNTATAASLELLQEKLSVPVIGVIEPGVQEALSTTKNNKIGVLATKACVESNTYKNILEASCSDVEVTQVAAQEFVYIVEHQLDDVLSKENSKYIEKAKKYTQSFIDNDVDTVILGCTHFPILYNIISKALPAHVNLVSPSLKTAEKVKAVLNENNLLNFNNKNPEQTFKEYEIYSTGKDLEPIKNYISLAFKSSSPKFLIGGPYESDSCI